MSLDAFNKHSFFIVGINLTTDTRLLSLTLILFLSVIYL